MRMERCPNGHFYDADKYGSCPYCGGHPGNEADGMDVMTAPYSADSERDFFDVHKQPESQDLRPTEPLQSDWSRPVVKPPVPPAAADSDKTIAYYGIETDPKKEAAKSQAAAKPVVGWLVCVDGCNYGKFYPLFAGRNLVGRAQKMDVYLEGDNAVSRDVHAIVVYEPIRCQYYVQPGDAHSLLYLNDDVVLAAEKLKDRDKLLLGNTTLMFVPFCDERFSWKKAQEEEKK